MKSENRRRRDVFTLIESKMTRASIRKSDTNARKMLRTLEQLRNDGFIHRVAAETRRKRV